MKLTRRKLLFAGGAGAVLAAGGVYELVDQLTGGSPSREVGGSLPPEQHLLQGTRVIVDNTVEVVVPPLHHQLVTANVNVGERKDGLKEAQAELEHILQKLEEQFEPSAAGLGITVAWGLPYFRTYVPKLADTHIPVDLRATSSTRGASRAILPS